MIISSQQVRVRFILEVKPPPSSPLILKPLSFLPHFITIIIATFVTTQPTTVSLPTTSHHTILVPSMGGHHIIGKRHHCVKSGQNCRPFKFAGTPFCKAHETVCRDHDWTHQIGRTCSQCDVAIEIAAEVVPLAANPPLPPSSSRAPSELAKKPKKTKKVNKGGKKQ